MRVNSKLIEFQDFKNIVKCQSCSLNYLGNGYKEYINISCRMYVIYVPNLIYTRSIKYTACIPDAYPL